MHRIQKAEYSFSGMDASRQCAKMDRSGSHDKLIPPSDYDIPKVDINVIDSYAVDTMFSLILRNI